MTMKNDAKFEKESTCWNLTNFDLSTENSEKCALYLAPFEVSIQCLSQKSTEELCFVTLKNDAKFEEELTYRFKINMRCLMNFWALESLKNLHFNGLFLNKCTMYIMSWFMINDLILNFHDWILCYHEPFHDKIKRWKSLELPMDLWNLKVILTLWTLNYVFSFLVLILFILLTIESTNFKKS